MIIKTTIAALGLLGSLTAGLSVTADAPKEPAPQTTVDAGAGKPAPARTAGTTERVGSGASANVQVEASIR